VPARSLVMKQLFNLITTAILVFALSSCGGDEAFTGGSGSSSSNIISAANFGVTASDLHPEVLQFAAGSITNPTSDKTAKKSDFISSLSPVDVEINVTAADNEGALVSSGTVYFSTQYGILSASSCELTAGRCSVTWQSVAELSQLDVVGDPTLRDIINVVTVWTQGVEGFTDLNGDQSLSDLEVFFDTDSPYLDRNDNRIYDITTDDTILPTPYTTFNNLYDGINCNTTNQVNCGVTNLIPIYDRVYFRLNYDSATVTAFNIAINTPTNNSRVLLGDTINFTATASDPDDGPIIGIGDPETNNNIIWTSSVDGTLIGNTNNINVATLTLGAHVITATAINNTGATTTDTVSVIVTALPAVTIDTPTTGASVGNGVNINFTATATDNEDGTITGTNAPVTGVDIAWSSSLDGAFGTNSNNINVTTLSIGAHVITVTVTDSDGNTNTSTINLTIT